MASCTPPTNGQNCLMNAAIPMLVVNPGSPSSCIVFQLVPAVDTDEYCTLLTNTAAFIVQFAQERQLLTVVLSILDSQGCLQGFQIPYTSALPAGYQNASDSVCSVGDGKTFIVLSQSHGFPGAWVMAYDMTPACEANVQSIINFVDSYLQNRALTC